MVWAHGKVNEEIQENKSKRVMRCKSNHNGLGPTVRLMKKYKKISQKKVMRCKSNHNGLGPMKKLMKKYKKISQKE
jgi:hypothetical protein